MAPKIGTNILNKVDIPLSKYKNLKSTTKITNAGI
jgi:hypothetical protein